MGEHRHTIADDKPRLFILRILMSFHSRLRPWRVLRNRLISLLLESPRPSIGGQVQLEMSHPELGGWIDIGSEVEIGFGAQLDISGGLLVCDGVTISEGARIFTHNHIVVSGATSWRDQGKRAEPIVIGEGAWIGAGAIVLGGTREIGSGGIVAAGAVVTKPVEPNAIVAGNPAAQIRSRE